MRARQSVEVVDGLANFAGNYAVLGVEGVDGLGPRDWKLGCGQRTTQDHVDHLGKNAVFLMVLEKIMLSTLSVLPGHGNAISVVVAGFRHVRANVAKAEHRRLAADRSKVDLATDRPKLNFP
jgi:hypothetical protein